MTEKRTFEDWQKIALSRNHGLSNPTDPKTPSKGSFTIYCKTCGDTFLNTAKNYISARRTGCLSCKKINARLSKEEKASRKEQMVEQKLIDVQPKEQKPEETLITVEVKQLLNNETTKSVVISPKKTPFYVTKSAQWAHISNPILMQKFLENENNDYSRFILEKFKNPFPKETKKFNGDEIQDHHIIPRHVGGENYYFNIVRLTKKDHIFAHKLRYLAYGDFGDYNFLHTVRSTGTKEVPRNPEFDKQIRNQAAKGSKTQQEKKIGIYAPGAAKKAGQISGTKPESDAKKASSMQQRGQETRDALNIFGGKWLHKETGTEVVILPGDTVQMRDVQKILASHLPVGHPNRVALERNTGRAGTSQPNALSKVVKKIRRSYQGWYFELLSFKND